MTDIDALIERLRSRKAFIKAPSEAGHNCELIDCQEAAAALAELRDEKDNWHGKSILDAAALKNAKAEIAKLRSCIEVQKEQGIADREMVAKLREALRGLLDHYVEMANSGDCGFWDCEQEEVVIGARAALGEKL